MCSEAEQSQLFLFRLIALLIAFLGNITASINLLIFGYFTLCSVQKLAQYFENMTHSIFDSQKLKTEFPLATKAKITEP